MRDHWCFEPIIGYGLVEPPKDFLEGSGSGFFVESKEGAKQRSNEIALLPHGKYAGMVLAPLHRANFSPDVRMIYCNPSQLRHMLFAYMSKNGRRVTSTLDPKPWIRRNRAMFFSFMAVAESESMRPIFRLADQVVDILLLAKLFDQKTVVHKSFTTIDGLDNSVSSQRMILEW